MIKAGVLEYEKRPLWYDVYQAHPPINEPVYKEDPSPDTHGLPDVKDNVREIFYPEDWARSLVLLFIYKTIKYFLLHSN